MVATEGQPPLHTRTRVVLLQHVLEQTEKSNTGRHAAAMLSALELRVFGARDVPLKTDDLEGAWLLWPGDPAPNLALEHPSTLVVLDGSWSQARRMMQRIPQLRGLRRWSLPVPQGRRSLREAPPGGMSSFEALTEALALLEGDAVAARMRAVHEALVQRQLSLRGYVGSQPERQRPPPTAGATKRRFVDFDDFAK